MLRFETFRGPELGLVGAEVRAVMGDDAVVVGNRVVREGRRTWVEVTAVRVADVVQFRAELTPAELDLAERPRGTPHVVALVGPSGAGKSTAAWRLAEPDGAFAGLSVGVLAVDGPGSFPFPAPSGATAPLHRIRTAAEVGDALAALAGCQVILVDTPAYHRRRPQLNRDWLDALECITPDEVHLVVPASIRSDVAADLRGRYGLAGVTHMLLSRLDEVPGDHGIVDLALRLALPARWTSDGPGLDGELVPACDRILQSLGLTLAPGELVVGTR
jgi:flagellar biosynthesis protein FlhF